MSAANNHHAPVSGPSTENYTRLGHLSALPKILLRFKDKLQIDSDQIKKLTEILLEYEMQNLKGIASLAAEELRIQNHIFQDKVELNQLQIEVEDLMASYKSVIESILNVNIRAKTVLHQEQLAEFNKLSFEHQYGGHHHPHG